MNSKRLTKSRNKIVSGVLAGVAEYFNIDPTLVRLLFCIASVCLAGFPGLIIYIIMLIIMPEA